MQKIRDYRDWGIWRAVTADDELTNGGYMLAAYPRGAKKDGSTILKADRIDDLIAGINEHERLGFTGCTIGG